MFGMLGLELGLSVRFRISVPYALNACKKDKIEIKSNNKYNQRKQHSPNITNVRKHVKNTHQYS